MSPDVKKINPNGVAALAKDVNYLSEFVDSLENAPILKENLDELQQTVHLMQTENPDEFFDISTRNKKFGRVDAMNGPKILEKYAKGNHRNNMGGQTDSYSLTHTVQSPTRTDRLANFSSRFGMK